MCGIVTILHPTKNVNNKQLIDHYIAQRSRGVNGYGFTYLTPKGYLKTMRFEDEAMCFYHLASVKSRLIMFHHRHPTSTQNIAFQNHPISTRTENGFYAMVHNGMISNHKELRTNEHKDIAYETEGEKDFNDSESLLHELVRLVETGKEPRSYGGMAFILLVADQNRKFLSLHYGRNEKNPLYHAIFPDGTHILSSENSAIDAKDIVLPNQLFGIKIENGEVQQLPPVLTKFSTWNDMFPQRQASHYNKNNYLSHGENSKWEKQPDGSFLERKSKKDELKSLAANTHEMYVSTLELAESWVSDLNNLNPKSLSEAEALAALKDIDEVIKECQNCPRRNTRRIKNAVRDLVEHRARILPVVPSQSSFQSVLDKIGSGMRHSLFRPNIANATDTTPSNKTVVEQVVAPPLQSMVRDSISSMGGSRPRQGEAKLPDNRRVGTMTQGEFEESLNMVEVEIE